ncbi:hypothetical protein D3C80_789670 [compost metagenome]
MLLFFIFQKEKMLMELREKMEDWMKHLQRINWIKFHCIQSLNILQTEMRQLQ